MQWPATGERSGSTGQTTLWVAGLAWTMAVIAGMVLLLRYEFTPSAVAEVTSTWPNDASFQASRTRPALILFVHPHCPCTRATVEQLNHFLARHGERVQTFVVFVRPPGVPVGWERTDIWRTVAGLPGVTAVVDEKGRDQRRFGARVSGETLLFDAAGRLLFRGGITPSRGHIGPSAGSDAIVALLKQPAAVGVCISVYGCPLLSNDSL